MIGAGAWIFHVAAMSVAPLSLVQAVLAGGMVLLAIMAEQMLGCSIGRRQWMGLALTAVGLMLLGFTLPAAHGADSQFSIPGMIGFEGVLIAAGTLLIMGPSIGAPAEHHGYMMGRPPGILFGVSDVAIKAISGMVGSAGVAGLLTPVAARVRRRLGRRLLLLGQGPPGRGRGPGDRGHRHGGERRRHRRRVHRVRRPAARQPGVDHLQCFAFVLVLGAAWLMPAPVRAGPVATAAAAAA